MKRWSFIFLFVALIWVLTSCNVGKESEAMTETESQTETESLPEAITELREDGALTLINKETNDRAILYSAPDASFLGDAYTVELSLDGAHWYPMDVWTARVAVQVKSSQYDLYTTYFVNFDCQGDIQLRVTPKADGDVRIRPEGRNQSRLDNGAVILTVSEPCQLSLEVGGDIYGNLQIFANPIEEVNKKDPRILYLGPGVHTLENCSLIRAQATSVGGEMHDTPTLYIPSGKTLYLAGGAVLQATVVMENAKNCAVAGRGIIDILPWNRDDNIRSSQNLPSPYGIRVFNSQKCVDQRCPCARCHELFHLCGQYHRTYRGQFQGHCRCPVERWI